MLAICGIATVEPLTAQRQWPNGIAGTTGFSMVGGMLLLAVSFRMPIGDSFLLVIWIIYSNARPVNIITESHHIGPSRTYTVLEITAARRIIDPDNDPEANRPELEAGRPLTFYVDPPRQPPLEVDQELESDAEPPRECFMVVQLPIDHRPMYNTINTPVRNVYGSYVSVQYVAQLEPPQVAAGEKPPMPQLEWKMAISANPGQLLHFFLMKNWKIGLPRLLVSDVGKFFDFVHKKREGDHRARPAPRRRRLVRRGFRITITEVYDDDDD